MNWRYGLHTGQIAEEQVNDKATGKPHVVIIGAGPAGLTAAYQLLKEGEYEVTVLEASPYIGGISRTAIHNGNRMDIGGHRFFSKSDEVNRLWQELMPLQGKPSYDDKVLGVNKDFALNGPDPEIDDIVMLLRNRVSRIFYLGSFFDYPISIKGKTFKNLGLGRTLKAGLGYLSSAIRKRPEHSLEDFYINRFGKPLYEMFFEDYTTKVWGKHPSEISASWGAQRVKGLSLLKTVTSALTKPFRRSKTNIETSLIDAFHYPKKGPGQYYETMADAVKDLGGQVYLEHEVTRVELRDDRSIRSVEAKRADGTRVLFKADAYFSSMPIKDLFLGFTGDAAPHEPLRQLGAHLPYRDFMTVGLLVERLKINNETTIPTLGNIVPDNWIYIQERSVQLGRLQIFNNWSPYLVTDPEKYVWIGLEYFCDEGDQYWTMDDAAFIEFATGELASIGIIDATDVKDAVRIRVKKAYPAYFGTYEQFTELKDYLLGIKNLYCIGRNGQHRYNNMDHSMLTSLRAVDVLMGRATQDELWNVNAEREYHEATSESDK